jgi:hypothetical protein
MATPDAFLRQAAEAAGRRVRCRAGATFEIIG